MNIAQVAIGCRSRSEVDNVRAITLAFKNIARPAQRVLFQSIFVPKPTTIDSVNNGGRSIEFIALLRKREDLARSIRSVTWGPPLRFLCNLPENVTIRCLKLHYHCITLKQDTLRAPLEAGLYKAGHWAIDLTRLAVTLRCATQMELHHCIISNEISHVLLGTHRDKPTPASIQPTGTRTLEGEASVVNTRLSTCIISKWRLDGQGSV